MLNQSLNGYSPKRRFHQVKESWPKEILPNHLVGRQEIGISRTTLEHKGKIRLQPDRKTSIGYMAERQSLEVVNHLVDFNRLTSSAKYVYHVQYHSETRSECSDLGLTPIRTQTQRRKIGRSRIARSAASRRCIGVVRAIPRDP